MSTRLLKVMVQAVFIADDGDELSEVATEPITLTATQWKALDPGRWATQGAEQVAAQLTPPTAPHP